ncbi:MAG: hypothetical protein R3F42_09375 [Pseudomonadota bacterium]
MVIAQPAVSLTDFALFIESTVFAALLWRGRAVFAHLQVWFVVFFLSLALAALAGGISHGFLEHRHPALDALVWSVTLLAIGLTGLSTWFIGAGLLDESWLTRAIAVLASLLFVLYVAVVLFVDTRFLVAVLYYLPATLFLLLLLLWRFIDTGHFWIFPGISGLVLAVAAAAVQQSGLTLHPVWLDHNVLYHLIQAAAMLLFFLFARHITRYRG